MRLFRQKNRVATRNAAVACVVEAMERRQLLAVTLGSDGTLSVVGSRHGDSITVGLDTSSSGRLKVVLNGASSTYAISSVQHLDIVSGSGNDRVVVNVGAAAPAFSVRVRGGNGNDSVRGSSGNDILEGGKGLDLLVGGAGNDRILGGSQADRLLGDLGDDTILGGTGNDTINTGGQKGDVVDGGPGQNRINTGAGGIITPGNTAHWEAAQVAAGSSGGSIAPLARPADTGYSPQQIRKAYGFGDLSNGSFTNRGAGQTVAVVIAYDYAEARHDLGVFSSEFGLPAPSKKLFGQVYATGVQPLPDDQWAGEAAMDIEWIHAIAPEARVILVHADSTLTEDLYFAVERAADIVRAAGGGVISMSFGSALGESPQDLVTERAFTRGNNTTVSFVGSAGDVPSIKHFPETSTHVVQVGGTTLPLDASGNRTGAETVWTFTGGGISQIFPRPSYQYGLTIDGKLHRVGRAGPDVSMVADPNTGAAVFHSTATDPAGTWAASGGTSLSAPLFSGLIALANQKRASNGRGPIGSSIHNVLYSLGRNDYSTNYLDVTSGSNGKPALPGFDLATGWGVPKAGAMIDSMAAAEIPTDHPEIAFEAHFTKPEGSAFPLARFVFGGTGSSKRLNVNEVSLKLGSSAEGLLVDFEIPDPLRWNGSAYAGTGQITLATNKGLPLTLNLRITANYNKRGKLVGQFVAVSKNGKILRALAKPVLIATFGPPV
jgi:hypothetical protein